MNVFDDGASNSEYGSSAPSPSMSFVSSRPSSSAGPVAAFGQQPNPPSSETYLANMSNTVSEAPLPTPLQLQTFGSFTPAQGSAASVQSHSTGDSVPGRGSDGLYPPYQSFDNMKLEDQQAFVTAAANANARYPGGMNNSLGYVNGAQGLVLSAGGREATINELKEFWSAFISEPWTGGPNGGHSLSKMPSMPALKTPLAVDRNPMMSGLNLETPRALYPNPSQQLMLGAAKDASNRDSTTAIPQSNDRSTAAASPALDENLRSYQEACLKRETPMLKLVHRPKSRTINSSDMRTMSQSPTLGSSVVSEQNPNRRDEMNVDHPYEGSRDVPFAAPFPPGSKEARDWSSRAAPNAGLPGGLNQLPGFASQFQQSSHPTARSASLSHVASRPTYKRLPSQTLGPEQSKKSKGRIAFPGEDSALDDNGSTGSEDDRETNLRMDGHYRVSYPQPGYTGGGNMSGGLQGSWMRQRSISSPTTARTFDWQPLDASAR